MIADAKLPHAGRWKQLPGYDLSDGVWARALSCALGASRYFVETHRDSPRIRGVTFTFRGGWRGTR